MAETGIVRFQGNLDPRAQEFIPTNHPNTMILFRPPPIFFPYVAPAPMTEFRVVPFPTAAAFDPSFPVVAGDSAAATRAVAFSGAPREASETSVRRELEAFGDVRAVQMERLRSDGIVTVHFYDLRSAESALAETRFAARSFFFDASPPGILLGRGVWARFVAPVGTAVPEGHNQGTLVVFNLDDRVSVSTLREIFKPFGAIKEVRETPAKRNQKFVEFFDVRDAAKALNEMNGKHFHGKPLVIEFSRPGGQCRRFLVNAALTDRSTTFTSSPSSSSSHSKLFTPNLPPRKLFPGRIFPEKPQLPARNHNKPSIFVKTWNRSTPSVDDPSKETSPSLSEKVLNPPPPATKARVIGRSTRSRKTKPGKKLDSRFLISEDAIPKDTRTTVMIKNIPNKYSQKLLLNMLDNHCIHCNKEIAEKYPDQPYSSYDFVYLPIDFNNKCNVGYGFVNMTSPEARWRLYKAFHLQLWEAFNSRKICEVTYARVQGLEALKEHFKNSKFPCEMDHYLPVLFSPPRDGRQLTEPLHVIGPSSSDSNRTSLSSFDGGEDGGPSNGDDCSDSRPNDVVVPTDCCDDE